jgi:hypothetical protein
MMRLFIALACAGSLAACSTTDIRRNAEKADTDASLAYAAIATTINAYEARTGVTPAQAAGAEGLKLRAWDALLLERRTYALAGTVDLTALSALAAEAKALGD